MSEYLTVREAVALAAHASNCSFQPLPQKGYCSKGQDKTEKPSCFALRNLSIMHKDSTGLILLRSNVKQWI